MSGLIPDRFVSHFSLLSQAIFLLVKATVTDVDLREADRLLSSFVSKVRTLYGDSAATFNVHQLLHLTKSVEMLGPLWGTSTFPFENGNGQLLKLVTAAQGVPLQIAERLIMKSWLKAASKIVQLPTFLMARKNKIIDLHPARGAGVHLLGAPLRSRSISNAVAELFFAEYGYVPNLTHYARMEISGMQIHSTRYSRPTKTCSNCIRVGNDMYCVVVDICAFMLHERNIVLVCQELVLSRPGFMHAMYIHPCQRPPPNRNLCLCFPKDVSDQCVLLDLLSESYVCDIPNNYKID